MSKPARTSPGERYAISENSNVFPLRQPGNIDDPLTDILRSGARRLLAQAIELEAETFLQAMKDLKLADGRDRLVLHGHGPERAVRTGIARIEVSRVKIRDRGAADDGERIRFTSAILPLCARRTGSLDSLLPVLYLRGVSTGDFQEVLSALLGTDAPNLSPAVIRAAWFPHHPKSGIAPCENRFSYRRTPKNGDLALRNVSIKTTYSG